MDTVVLVFSSHLKLNSIREILKTELPENKFLLLSPHKVYPNEIKTVTSYLTNAEFICFSDLLSDKDMEQCDVDADTEQTYSQSQYYDQIKVTKNKMIIKRLKEKNLFQRGYIFNDDLGIESECWQSEGFIKVNAEYYYKAPDICINIFSKIRLKIASLVQSFQRDAYVAHWAGRKYVFYGNLNRISYRLGIEFKKSPTESFMRGLEGLYSKFISKSGINREITRLTTFHEYCPIGKDVPLTVMQDGFLPANYTSRYMKYLVGDINFLTWDKIGLKTFEHQNLPAEIIPFRKKLTLPTPVFPKKLKKVLCVSSGAGDWTALKNRSDEDNMVIGFAEIARRNPDIEFVYRCHPVWIIPQHQGVNSIQRVIQYYDSLGLPNLHVSSNIPSAYQDGKMILSYKRTSLEEDLKDVDMIFGEHSISMIDGAFKNILFASVNLTGRRNFFASITELGFPHCESIDAVCKVIESVNSDCFKSKYLKAIDNYNTMTEEN